MYSAQTQLLVEPLSSASTSNGVVMTPEGVASQVEVITSRPVAAAVVNDLGLDERPETLLKSVTVASVSDHPGADHLGGQATSRRRCGYCQLIRRRLPAVPHTTSH
jgi:uncharacterized protein involved in exopolysaccharide biosynthesis